MFLHDIHWKPNYNFIDILYIPYCWNILLQFCKWNNARLYKYVKINVIGEVTETLLLSMSSLLYAVKVCKFWRYVCARYDGVCSGNDVCVQVVTLCMCRSWRRVCAGDDAVCLQVMTPSVCSLWRRGFAGYDAVCLQIMTSCVCRLWRRVFAGYDVVHSMVCVVLGWLTLFCVGGTLTSVIAANCIQMGYLLFGKSHLPLSSLPTASRWVTYSLVSHTYLWPRCQLHPGGLLTIW